MTQVGRSIKRHPMLAWLTLLGLAIATHRIGWDFVSLPLTFCALGAGFVVTQVEFFSARRQRRRF